MCVEWLCSTDRDTGKLKRLDLINLLSNLNLLSIKDFGLLNYFFLYLEIYLIPAWGKTNVLEKTPEILMERHKF